jgi:GNAT superfamily N-acetyltransferase
MRQVAVEALWQGAGIGKALVKYAEKYAFDAGYKKMILHARETALDFYRHLNYTTGGGTL